MSLTIRLLRTSWLFGRIFVAYFTYWLMRRVFGRDTQRGVVVPPWLQRIRSWLDARTAKKLYRAFVRFRGVYIKVGQVLSMMGGFLPPIFAKELEALQDAVPPQRTKTMTAVIERDLGKKVDALFTSFEPRCLAAASLGQVHRATLKDGRQVAVKILYPGIRDVIRVDMRVIRWALKVYKLFVPVSNIESLYDAVKDMLRRETDYELESRNMQRMAQNFDSYPRFEFPEPITEFCARDVLTMTFMDGHKITDHALITGLGLKRETVAKTLIEGFYKQLFIDRFFHADPHPGNFLVRKAADGSAKIIVLDRLPATGTLRSRARSRSSDLRP